MSTTTCPFKAGDVVLNNSTGAVHLMLTDEQFIHIISSGSDLLNPEERDYDTNIYPTIYEIQEDWVSKCTLLCNLGEDIAKYLGYKNAIYKDNRKIVTYSVKEKLRD